MTRIFDKAKTEAKLAELRTDLDSKVAELNRLLGATSSTVEEVEKAKAAAKEAADEWNQLQAVLQYNVLLTAEHPMLTLVTALQYATLAVTEVVDKETHEVHAELRTRSVYFSPDRLYRMNSSVAAASDWRYKMDRLECLLAMRAADEIGTSRKMNDSELCSNLVKEFEGVEKISNNLLTDTLKSVSAALLGSEFKPTKKHARYMLLAITQKAKTPATIKVMAGRHADNVVLDALHAAVTDKGFAIEYALKDRKQKKEKKSEDLTATPTLKAPEAPKAEAPKAENKSAEAPKAEAEVVTAA